MSYHLQLPAENRVHPVFNVSLLKSFHGPLPSSIEPIPDLSTSFLPQPRAIVDGRVAERDGRSVMEVLVEWSGSPREDAW